MIAWLGERLPYTDLLSAIVGPGEESRGGEYDEDMYVREAVDFLSSPAYDTYILGLTSQCTMEGSPPD